MLARSLPNGTRTIEGVFAALVNPTLFYLLPLRIDFRERAEDYTFALMTVGLADAEAAQTAAEAGDNAEGDNH